MADLIQSMKQSVNFCEQTIDYARSFDFHEQSTDCTEVLNERIAKHKSQNVVHTNCSVVEYENNKYIVCKSNVAHEGIESRLFVTDYDMLDKVMYIPWNVHANGYITYSFNIHPYVKRMLYLHNCVMNKLTFDGKGSASSIDHINRIRTDNRRENLRELTQTLQNYNQRKRIRKVTLPNNCGIKSDDLPKGVCYRPSDGKHDELFVIEIKGLLDFPKGRFRKETTKSKDFSLKCKLEEAKIIIIELCNFYPHLVEYRNLNNNYIKQVKKYNAIIELSKFKDWYKYTIEIPEKHSETEENFTEKEKKIFGICSFLH